MKLMMTSTYFYPEGGGLENYVYNLSKFLIGRYKLEVTVVCSNFYQKKYREENIDGIHVYRLPYLFKLSATPLNSFRYCKLDSIIKEEKPEIINGHVPVSLIGDAAARICHKTNIPFILTYHAGTLMESGVVTDIIGKIYQRLIERATLAQADKIIAVSEFVRDNCLSKYKDKVSIVYPGVDINRFRPSNSVMRIQNSILFVAQLSKAHKWSGLDYLLDAVKLIKADISDVKLAVVGSGDYMGHYRIKAKKLNIESDVIFKGRVPDNQLIKEYQQASVFVLPEYTNAGSFGMVLAEAMACKTPVIGTTVGGISCVIMNNEIGLLVPPKDPKALASAIIKLLRDEQLAKKFGENGYKRVLENFTWDKSAAKTWEIYQELIDSKNSEGMV